MEYRNPKELQPHPISLSLYGENHIDDLAESIQEHGILVPLTITGKNLIISGHRRWRCALELNLEAVPIEVKTFIDEWAEKRAILGYNKQREKTFSQKMNEAQLLKELISQNTQKRQALSISDNSHQIQDHGPKVGEQTRDVIATKVGMGSGRTLSRAEEIWDKAQEGNIQAQELIKDLDSGEKTIRRALRELQATEKRETFVASKRDLPQGIFDVLYADCPWQYEFSEVSREVEKQYPTMTPQELKDLALQLETHIAEVSVLFLWATAPKLIEALEVMKAWGFSYRTHAIWDKEKIGMGYWFRGQHELLLVGTKGNYPPPAHEARFSSIIKEARTAHSAKPQRVYEMIESICPNSKYLELFARSKRKGWESWGNEPE